MHLLQCSHHVTSGRRLLDKKQSLRVDDRELASHVRAVAQLTGGVVANYSCRTSDGFWGKVAMRMGRYNSAKLRKRMHRVWRQKNKLWKVLIN